MKGDKTFTYPFTVSKAGTYTIPAVSFSFFDPSSEKYKTLHTQRLAIRVTPGKGNPQKTYVRNLKAEGVSQGTIENMDPILLLDLYCCRHLFFLQLAENQ